MAESPNIHPTAVVDPGAELDATVTVGAYAVIGAQVRVGAGTVIGPHAVITGRTTIGQNNRIFQFASLGEIPQDKKYANEESELLIGDHNTIREFVTLNRGTAMDCNQTRIGSHNWIMAYVHIAHDCVVGDHVTFANGATLAGHVQVEDHATLGGFTLVHQFCRIGQYAFSGMGCALNRDLPPYVTATGNPARSCDINREGLHRAGMSGETVDTLRRAYALLMRRGAGPEDEDIKPLAEACPQVAQLCAFIAASSRGIIRESARPSSG